MSAYPNTKTDFLIVRAGSSRASLACFLVRYGNVGLFIASPLAPLTSPRSYGQSGTVNLARPIC
ncbi:uncharacterized protein BDR25DRAFT_223660 [Lindgomyces ingoldianus]|uniref:Uncharacterized protein n=1 Tax=Lindgomyces ingoldianus TaxID=673940 RepID=A0ACB6QWY4_9PLEO|nr:uncharacterized protein BDR25DRAFT_223660 [Lindgomyces ingoldianus]KAF2471421.1 hypothetical protein BDR25DRAFT_223660 [Lindgomyces ingoldianus]